MMYVFVCVCVCVCVYSKTSRNNAPISNYRSGFRCKSEFPWCIKEVKKLKFYQQFSK
ncbi:Uncharacterized protein FWK35_00008951 [Aphis craccivora]|uniref:Uncharacterized protein n=1 Tax=Aphis craccivora TaxID=307492 RepID=A0A6G0YTM6_APHCR|nr:Uncharacterized protein FWK35_00008951 [Aphis craccivora]